MQPKPRAKPEAPRQDDDAWVAQRGSRKRFTMDMPETLHCAIKMACVTRRTTMVEEICRILEAEFLPKK